MGKVSNIEERSQIAKLQSDKTKLKKQIEELEEKQTKLISDLETLKTTGADLVIAQQELRECDEGLEIEMKKNLQCQSDKKSIQNNLEELMMASLSVLMLSTRRSTNSPTLIGLNGLNGRKDLNFTIDEEIKLFSGCGAILNGQMMYFGNNPNKRQVYYIPYITYGGLIVWCFPSN